MDIDTYYFTPLLHYHARGKIDNILYVYNDRQGRRKFNWSVKKVGLEGKISRYGYLSHLCMSKMVVEPFILNWNNHYIYRMCKRVGYCDRLSVRIYIYMCTKVIIVI